MKVQKVRISETERPGRPAASIGRQEEAGRRGAAIAEEHGSSSRAPRDGQVAGNYTPGDPKQPESTVEIVADNAVLKGDLHIPASPSGAVLFAHGSGSSRSSPRNQFVARALHDRGMATLLLDLLTEEEEVRERHGAELRFDIGLLTRRLQHATEWLTQQRELARAKIGIFGASTGAAAALATAADDPAIAAVVSRGGRPDMAADVLEHVHIPVLLIVGSHDRNVLNMNRQALARLPGEKKLEVIAGATHLFEEAGALEQVAQLAAQWFGRFLGSPRMTKQAA